MAGRPVVGAAGGGVLTLQVLNGTGDAGVIVTSYNSGKEVIPALDNGDVAAAVFVGAQPLPNIAGLPNKGNYKLLPIYDPVATKVGNVYRKSKVNYPGITSAPIDTLAPVATLMTRRFSTEKKVAAQRALRNCFEDKLDELQDTKSRVWQDVKKGDPGVLLNWLELPAPAVRPRK